MRSARIVVEDSEVDLDVFEVKKKLLKSDSKLKTRIHFDDFVNAVHNCERRSQFWIVNERATTPLLGRQLISHFSR